MSAASFKAGRYSASDQCLDLMIDIEKERQALRNIQKEVENQLHVNAKKSDFEERIDRKTETEVLLNFLIEQLLHYLSILKK